MNIAFASDNNYAQHTAVAMASILKCTRLPEQVHFFLIADSLTAENQAKIEQTVKELKGRIDFLHSSNPLLKELYVSAQLSRTAYFRLELPELLPADVEKVIYLDCDLLVFADISELWDFDMQGRPLAAVADFGIMASKKSRKQKAEYIGLAKEAPYFNSGVLLMDIRQWRIAGYAKQVERLAASREYPHHDQDALNRLFMGNWAELPLRWNVIPPVYHLFLKILCSRDLRARAIAARQHSAILHYAGGYKPWEYKPYRGFNEVYYHYLADTAFRDAVMPQPDTRRKGRSIRRQLLRLKVADLWARLLG